MSLLLGGRGRLFVLKGHKKLRINIHALHYESPALDVWTPKSWQKMSGSNFATHKQGELHSPLINLVSLREVGRLAP